VQVGGIKEACIRRELGGCDLQTADQTDAPFFRSRSSAFLGTKMRFPIRIVGNWPRFAAS
jgi:hypothetical protein